ncbi:MAG: murein L,D-transpeptidase [Sphingomonas sp. 28-66-16]|nr:MAG: murein L,D-transpeptidase [Sphingomonas sp. 28-66-16]
MPISADQLRTAATDQSTRQFYEGNGWRPIWSDSAAKALQQSLAERDRHGLDRLDFLDSPLPAGGAAREVALTRGALRYARALAHGVTDPADLHVVRTIPRDQSDPGKQLVTAIAAGKLGVWLTSLAPQDADYARLSQAYLVARHETGSIDEAEIGAGVIRVGDTDSRVRAIVEQLVGGEYLAKLQANAVPEVPPAAPTGPERYTQDIADAVARLQRDYGIAADGIIGPDTLEVLNLRPGDRARTLAVALERLRWLTRAPPATRIDVNTASALLFYYRDGKLVDSRRVIVGQPGKETPQLRAPMFRLVANPTWTIPKSIQHGEMARVSAAYLRRNRMIRRNGWIIQKSGPGNALGLVKFDMKDKYAIYLHDTSAPSLFERSERHLSHGCVRVADASGFAQLIAEDQGIADQWAQARASGSQKFVPLPHQIPVRLLYHNAFVDGQGAVAYRTDPYGWNAPIAKALGFGKVSNVRVRAGAGDISP